MKALFKNDKKKILNLLKSTYGIESSPHLFLSFGKEKIRIFSGSLSLKELGILDTNINIETVGLYAFNLKNDEIRLTLDSLYVYKDQITKNIIDLSDDTALEWFKGSDLFINKQRSFVVLKNQDDLIGCGKSTGEKITNFMPKERRIRE